MKRQLILKTGEIYYDIEASVQHQMSLEWKYFDSMEKHVVIDFAHFQEHMNKWPQH